MKLKRFSDSRKHLVFKIGMPVLLTVLLFVISSFFIVIPSIEKNYMDNKRELIKELTQTAVSTFSHLHSQALSNEISQKEAKIRAIAHIRNLRYGEDNKDYFWVTDMQPVMVAHPYRADLEGQDMAGFVDRSGLPIFVKFVNIVKKSKSGYLTYTWQFKDQADTIVPKLSYVQSFEPWGWIVGTGIYIEDVKANIASLKQRLTQISVSITLVICLLLFYVTRQSMRIDTSAIPEIVGVKKAKKEQENLLAELQTALLYLNQPIKDLAADIPIYETTLSIQALSRLMSKHRHTCVLICDDKKIPVGIVTDSDIRRRVVSEGIDLSTPVSQIMSFPLISIQSDAMIYEAITRMKENSIRHILVKDRKGDISQYISAKTLIQNHQYSLTFLSHQINTAASADELFDLKSRIPQLITSLVNCSAYPQNITRIITTISEAILNRLINFAIEALGPPPIKFAFIVMGSVGRQEQTLKTDQDNAIIFEDIEDDKMQDNVQAYFLELGNKVSGWLDRIGYDFCKGDIMAKNPRWCVSLSTWKKYFQKWIDHATPQDLLDTKIFFDFRFMHGDESLCDDLRSYLDEQLDGKSAFLAHLVQNCLFFKPPIGMFKKLIVEPVGEYREKLSLKKCMTPIVDLARIYSLKHGIHATNTLERLESLALAGILNPGEHKEISQTYTYLMQLRFRHQSECLSRNVSPDNYIAPKLLTRIDQVMLKEILSSVAGFQTRLSNDFKTIVN